MQPRGYVSKRPRAAMSAQYLHLWRIRNETTFHRRLLVRRLALRMLRPTFVLMELPLPRLPARERQRLLSSDVCAENRT